MANESSKGLVSIIIVTFNGRSLLEVSLASIARQTYKNYEVIVVDNGSNDNTNNWIAETYPEFHYVQLSTNTGFSHANNVGIMHSKGEFLFFLNNDTELDSNCLNKFVQAAESSNLNIGMFSGKVLQYDNRSIIDNTGHLLYPDGLNRGRGRLEKDLGQFDKSIDIAFPSGCAAFFRRGVLEKIGNFDEDYFLYGEDADLGFRARLSGWGCYYVPEAVIYHMYSATSGQYSAKKAYFVERNRLWLMWKNYPAWAIISSTWYTLLRIWYLGLAMKKQQGSAGMFVKQGGSLELLKIGIQSWLDAFRRMPTILKKRKTIQNQRSVSNSEIRGWFKRYRISARELMLKA